MNPASDDIARLAYLIWEKEGEPQGREMEHWFQAESLLTAATQVEPPAQIAVKARKLPKPTKQKKGNRSQRNSTPHTSPAGSRSGYPGGSSNNFDGFAYGTMVPLGGQNTFTRTRFPSLIKPTSKA